MNYSDGLETDVRFVKGVGPQRAKLLEKAGIRTVRQLIDLFPIRYECFKHIPGIIDLYKLNVGEKAVIVAKIENVKPIYSRRSRIIAEISDGHNRATVRWFNSMFLLNKLKSGQWAKLIGRVNLSGKDDAILTNPSIQILNSPCKKEQNQTEMQTQPIYPKIKGIFTKTLTKIIYNALENFGKHINEWHSKALLAKNHLINIRQAYTWIHQPADSKQSEQARLRFAYDELFFMQMGILLSRRKRQYLEKSPKLICNDKIDTHIRRRFPFELTESQDNVIKEIISDMNSDRPMYRLLQGDVGAGKTVVALYAALVAVANRKQVAIMAPTEILANQHYQKVCKYLEKSNVKIALLVGATKPSERKKTLEKTAQGEIDILIGTHSLIQKDVKFASLGLVIIDEQHKFGVAQRLAMQTKGFCPHYLIMTATPIPRSLALTIFGDLQISVIDKLPPGRKPTITKLFKESQINNVWNFVRKRLQNKEQGFVVYPLLNPSDKSELKSATRQAKYLAQEIFPEFQVELIHGQLKSSEKKEIMKRFAEKKCDLLVATVVIEVGIDVPDASVLVIEHAERFGLSQLHQLRGRVGRNGQQGYCLLVANIRNEYAQKRLNIFTKTTDGFKIAEEDLRLRGPGEFFGTAQHGLPELKIANLIDDYQLMLIARNDVKNILRKDPALIKPENRKLREELIYRLGDKFQFIDAA